MDDPFGLLEIMKQSPSQEEKKKTLPKKVYLSVISILALFTLVLVSIFVLQNRGSVSADIESSSVAIKINNLPGTIKTGETISFNLVFSNRGNNLDGAYVLIQGQGINLAPSIQQVADLSPDQEGYMRKLSDEEYARFDAKGDSGVYWFMSSLKSDEPKTLSMRAIVTSGGEVPTNIEAKLMVPKYKISSCSFLGLLRCKEQDGFSQIASGVFQIEPLPSGKIKLRSGFNFVSLPYVFTSNSLSEFFASLKSKWAYVYVPTTGEYLSLLTQNNTSKIKPGTAFWLYDSEGGEYDLPETKVETNINETYSIALDIGWNQVGNPYSKRMILSGSKILVRELSDDGTESGTAYDLKTAISEGTLSDPYGIVYPTSGESSNAIKTAKMILENNVEAFSGFLIKAEKKVNLVIPGKEVIAPGDVISSAERAKIEVWISGNGLNQFGDPIGTVYAGGTPLFDEKTGQSLDRLDYVLAHHPDRPWNR